MLVITYTLVVLMIIMFREKAGIKKDILIMMAQSAAIINGIKPIAFMPMIAIGFIRNFGHLKNLLTKAERLCSIRGCMDTCKQ